MNVKQAAAASLFTIAAAAGAQTTGVSHPEDLNDSITTVSSPTSSAHYVKPSPAIPVETPAPAPISAPLTAAQEAPVLHAHTVEPTASYAYETQPKHPVVDPDDVDSGVVTEVPAGPNELPVGTLIRVSLDKSISTETARKGEPFTAHLTADLQRRGKVLIPTGSLLRGRITEVREGKTFGASAMLRLQPDSVTLPDGTRLPLAAEVIDFDHTQDSYQNSKISGEGNIVANQHVGAKLGALGLTTGSAAVAGAVLGGGVGAVVGAGIGAGAGVIWWAKQNHQQTIPEGTVLVLNLDHNLSVVADGQ